MMPDRFSLLRQSEIDPEAYSSSSVHPAGLAAPHGLQSSGLFVAIAIPNVRSYGNIDSLRLFASEVFRKLLIAVTLIPNSPDSKDPQSASLHRCASKLAQMRQFCLKSDTSPCSPLSRTHLLLHETTSPNEVLDEVFGH
jgi:hypothetical protein